MDQSPGANSVGRMTEYSFSVDEVKIIDGSEEGISAWITVNFLLERLRPKPEGASDVPAQKHETALIMDLGGGSTQIVFETREGEDLWAHPEKAKHASSFRFGGMNYSLYQHSK